MRLFGNINKSIRNLLWLIILTNIAIIADIPFLRQILGFIVLTFLPGLLVLQILKITRIGLVEIFIISIGVSISVLLLIGILYNIFLLALGFKSPLSTIPLLLMLNIILLICILTIYFTNSELSFTLPAFKYPSEKALLIIPSLFPAFSVFGIYYMNLTNDNTFLVFILLLIPLYVVFMCFYNPTLSYRIQPIVILLIGISLTQMFALRSNHIIGTDRHLEYYVFQMTLNNQYWSILGRSTLDACLSISLLPTIYQIILNVNPESLYRTFIPIIFSVSPLAIYSLSKYYLDDSYAFLASFLFMSQLMFVSSPGGRTNLALFFFALIMVVLFCDRMNILQKRILIIAFLVSCIFTHYSTTYIVFIVFLVNFLLLAIFSKKFNFGTNSVIMSPTLLLLFFAIIFLWYSQITNATFESGVYFFRDVLYQLISFFEMESRDQEIYTIIGVGVVGIPMKLHFVFSWLILIFIFMGFFAVLQKFNHMADLKQNYRKPNFLKHKFDVEFISISIVCLVLLGLSVILPYISKGYNVTRVYALSVVSLSTFFVIGGIYIFLRLFCNNWTNNNNECDSLKINSNVLIYVIMLCVLIPNYFCVTGITYEAFNYPRSIVLNSDGNDYDIFFIHDHESCCAKWLKQHYNDASQIYSDNFGERRLISQGLIPVPVYSGSLVERIDRSESIDNGYIYLRYCAVVEGKLLDKMYQWHNLTDYQDIIVERNLIYSNNGSQILL